MSSSNHWPEMAFNMTYCRWKSFISWENYGDLQNRCRNVQPNNVDYLKCAVEDLLVLCELSMDGRSNRFKSKLLYPLWGYLMSTDFAFWQWHTQFAVISLVILWPSNANLTFEGVILWRLTANHLVSVVWYCSWKHQRLFPGIITAMPHHITIGIQHKNVSKKELSNLRNPN